MAVIFDLYLFTKDYVEKVKEDERESKSRSRRLDEGETEYEIGTVACRNSARTQPIFFYNVDELLGLLESGFAVSKENEAQEREIGEDLIPDEAAALTIVEIDSDEPLAGRFIEPDGQTSDFASGDELREKLAKYVYVDA